MRAVHSFWFSPFFESSNERALGGFSEQRFFWYSLTLSLLTAKKLFNCVDLYTDSYGLEMASRLKLPYSRVENIFENVPLDRAVFWNYGKYLAYLRQNEPFLHLDMDVFIWKPLPAELLSAQIFGQSMESLDYHRKFYGNTIKVMQEHLVYYPSELSDFDTDAQDFGALNCGIFGGSALELIRAYCEESLKIMDCRQNKTGWEAIRKVQVPYVSVGSCCAALEQLCITAWCKRAEIAPQVLIPGNIHDESTLAIIGYTHLIAEAKKTPAFLGLLEDRMNQSCPKWKRIIDAELARQIA